MSADSIMTSHRLMIRSCQFHICNVSSIQDKDAEQRYKALFITQTRGYRGWRKFQLCEYHCRCHILSLQYYNEGALSILLHYSPKRDKDGDLSGSLTPDSTPLPHQAVAQLPIEGMVSLLPWDTVESHDPTESVDIGHILTQVCPLGPFRAGKLAVSGTRKLVAVVKGLIIKINVTLYERTKSSGPTSG